MKTTLRLVAARFVVLLGAYFFVRCFFFIYNRAQFVAISHEDIFEPFLLGMRFDIATIIQLNAGFFLIWLLPYRLIHHGLLARFIMGLFFFLNLPLLALNLVDAELVNFSGQRVTMNYFMMAHDVTTQFGQLVQYYWFIALVSLALWGLLIHLFTRRLVPPTQLQPLGRRRAVAAVFLFLALCVLGIRGGFQDKPLRPAHAYRFQTSVMGQLALNSTFTMLQSGRGAQQKKLKFYDQATVTQILTRDRTPHFQGAWPRPQNVVLFIVESLATEFVGVANNGKGYTPFLDSLATKGLYFRNSFANGRRSLEALPSILASVPSLLNTPFLTSSFQGSEILGLGEALGRHGYESGFFHGAANGSMFFDSFAYRAGMKHYFGLNEYPDKKDYDGFWGIADEPFLQFALSKMREFTKPFVATVFTLSSHQPYTIPPQHHGKFPKGTLEIHESIGYADYALAQFFAAAEKEPWFQDTLFIITGDHTQKNEDPQYANEWGHYRVPFLLYHPRARWPTHDLTRVVQHADILPTILDVLDIQVSDLSRVGSSVFARPEDAFVVNRTEEGFWYLAEGHYLKLDLNFGLTSFRYDKDFKFEKVSNESVAHEAERFKAYLQYVINGVIENKLHAR